MQQRDRGEDDRRKILNGDSRPKPDVGGHREIGGRQVAELLWLTFSTAAKVLEAGESAHHGCRSDRAPTFG
jgi:hypothetical protein